VQGIHKLIFNLTAVESEKQGALHHITGINEKHVWLNSAHAVNHNFAARNASEVITVNRVNL
jgi:hypothetical protein